MSGGPKLSWEWQSMSMNYICPIEGCHGNVQVPNGAEDDDTVECNNCHNTFTVHLEVYLEPDKPVQPVPQPEPAAVQR